MGGDLMAGTFNSWAALKAHLQSEMLSAMDETESLSYLDALKNTSNYRQVEPEVYKVTYQLENSAKTTGVLGSGNSLSAQIYLDMGFNYNTGTWSTPKVFSTAEAGGLINPGGFWEKTEQDIQRNLDSAFGKRFNG